MNEKFLYFVEADDVASVYPLSRLQSISHTDTLVKFYFAPGILGDGQAASVDVVAVTVTTDETALFVAEFEEALRSLGSKKGQSNMLNVANVSDRFVSMAITYAS